MAEVVELPGTPSDETEPETVAAVHNHAELAEVADGEVVEGVVVDENLLQGCRNMLGIAPISKDLAQAWSPSLPPGLAGPTGRQRAAMPRRCRPTATACRVDRRP